MSSIKGFKPLNRDLSYHVDVLGYLDKDTTFFNKAGVASAIEALKNLGISWVGVGGIEIINSCKDDLPAVVSTVKGWLDKSDFKVSSCHYWGPSFSSLDDKNQDAVKEFMCKNMEIFKLFRPVSIVMHPGWMMSDDNTPEGNNKQIKAEFSKHGRGGVMKVMSENIRLLARAAKKYDIKLALENTGANLVFGGIRELPELVNLINEPNVGYCVDSGHAHEFGESVVEWLRIAGDKLYETHFHDNRGRGKDEHFPVGFGTISWLDVIATLNEIGFPGPVTFEAMGWPVEDKSEGYRQAIAWWRACENLAEKL